MDSFTYLDAGTIVADRYRIVSPLASGGFGAVYVAEQLATERAVALKMLWPHHVQGGVERFLLEARIAGRLNSEHIVQVLDAGTDATHRAPFLVMELLEGSDFEQLIEREGPLTPERTVEYLRQVAVGLDKAHRFVERDGRPTPIVHRDLKPGNLFLTRRDSGNDVVKILDFGIAKVVSASHSLSGGIRGTPLYMAYEQAAQCPITPAADIWSLGLIAFFLLTGRPYWRAAFDTEQVLTRLFAEVLTLPLEPPSVRAQQLGAPQALPPAFDEWFARAVNRDPGARHPSAGQAVHQLALAFGLNPGASFGARSIVAHTPSGAVPSSNAGGSAHGGHGFVPTLVLATQEHAALGRTQGSPAGGRRLWLLAGVPLVLLAAVSATVRFLGGEATTPSTEKSAAQPSQAVPRDDSGAPRGAPEASSPTARPEEPVAAPQVTPIVTASATPRASSTAGHAPRPRSTPRVAPRASASLGRPGAVRGSEDKPSSIYGVR